MSGKLRTENNIPNRKIRFMAYAGAITTILFVLLNRIFNIEVDEAMISEVVTSLLVLVTAVMSIVGYYTNPEKGDGVTDE